LETLSIKIRKNLDLYMNLRKTLKLSESDPSEKPEKVAQMRKNYRDLRDKISVSKDF
jgi:isocitrate/isopropylmalate dehydrogenase